MILDVSWEPSVPPRHLLRSALLIASAVIALALPATAAAAGRYVVVLREGASAQAAAERHGSTPERLFSRAIRGYSATMSDAALRRASRDAAVLYVTRDRAIRTTAKPAKGGGDPAPAQVIPTGISRIGQAPSRVDGISNDGIDVDVAVIDTGIDGKHSDLHVVGGHNCSTGRSWSDGNGHGTHVSGTIAAIDNGIGVVGVAPGARLHAVRVLDNNGSGSYSSVICGLDWVLANAATIDVVNMSLGGGGSDGGDCGNATNDALHRAICRVAGADIPLVVSAGNSSADASGSTPAAYDEVITVSAWTDFDGLAGGTFEGVGCRTDEDDSFASFSNFGPDVDIAAPGTCILSTWKGGSYETISGTSMSAPHVAGAAALHLSTNPTASAADVRAALLAGRTFPAVADDPDGVWEGLLSIAGWL